MDEDLREFMAAHRAGRLDEAEAGYRRVLAARPGHAKALYYLGLLSFHLGRAGEAIALLQECLVHAPSNGPAWNTLGSMLKSVDRSSEAREAYRRATLAMPSMGEAWYNLGVCQSHAGDAEDALTQFRSGIERQPDYAPNRDALAALLYRLGRLDEAAQVYRAWAMQDPLNPTAVHLAAAALQRAVPARAADAYVRQLFDSAADSFDADLTRLNYRAPRRVADALTSILPERQLAALLDAGCGTGLCGPLLRPLCARLAGVDLSPRMLEQARARHCYDELCAAELCDFLRRRSGSFDAVVSADTLVYFGSLEEPLRAARTALRAGGALIFTLEAAPAAQSEDWRLELHGRYVHREAYVRAALAAAGLELAALSYESLREEHGRAVRGLLVSALSR